MNKSKEYMAGFDCGLNGSNTDNCHFSFFSSREQTDEWEAGKKEGEKMKHINMTLTRPWDGSLLQRTRFNTLDPMVSMHS